MKKIALIFFICIVMSLSNEYSLAYKMAMHGEAIGWGTFNDDEWLTGLRYIPEVRLSYEIVQGKDMDAEISLNTYTWAPADSPEEFDDNADLKLYRSWLRYSTAQFEIRPGLQKINFGPAKILRSLMWFDQLDPRDPLKLTDGVYALLGRY